MANAVWTGTLSFGLVTLPVRLYPATQPKDVRFHLYDPEGRRIRSQRGGAGGAEPPAGWDQLPAHDPAGDEGPPPAREAPAATKGAVETPVAWDDVVRGV